ncbi:MAG TPA: ATP-binding protein [Anaeromyxobacteraceae bacterium]|nr:ATP-binding protein [Anaeromyxobacteraceae bacterium]
MRRVLLLYVGVDLGFGAYDLVRGLPPVGIVVARAALLAALLLAIWAVTRLQASHLYRALRVICGCLAPAIYAVICAVAGGTADAYFAVLPAFPMLYVLALPDDPQGPIVPVAGSVTSGLALLVHEGAAVPACLEWLVVALFLGGAAVQGALLLRRARADEIAHERARAETAEALVRSEKLRLRAERLATIGRLAAGVAHEIGNPLTYVSGNVDALLAQCDGGLALRPDQHREMLSDTAKGIARITQIVEDLRSLARERPKVVEVCRPGEIVDEALRLASMKLRQVGRVERLIPADLAPVHVDRGRVLQALVNVIANAAEAAAMNQPSSAGRWVKIQALVAGGELRLVVDDSGPGLAPEVRERLFEAFHTTKKNGTGLGLALSREYLESCGGRIEAGDAPGAGARFVIGLPLAPAGAPAGAASQRAG